MTTQPARKIKVAPSMMCADFLNLGEELHLFAAEGVDWLHIDVMDGHYVPNFTLGIDYCRALHGASKIPLDVHLMIEQPDRHVAPFCAIPGTRVTFHPETVRQPLRLIESIREAGGSPGIAIDPGQTVDQFRHLIPQVDLVLIMTVNPGYAGQKLIPHCVPKIGKARDFIAGEGLKVDLEVDGNVSWQNIPLMVGEGANILVAGTSSLFEKGKSRKEAFQRWKALVDKLEKESL